MEEGMEMERKEGEEGRYSSWIYFYLDIYL
jgi:hypothetical protein